MPWMTALRSLRVHQWWYFATLPLGALAFAVPTWGDVFLGVCCASACLAAAFGLNAITDRAGDRCAWKNPLVGRGEGAGRVLGLTAGCGAVALLTASWVGPTALLAAGLSVLAGLVYSVGPRWKARPGIGTLCNGVIFTPLLFVGTSAVVDTEVALALTIALMTLVTQNQLLHEAADMDEDHRSGTRTTVVVIGAGHVKRVGLALGAVGAATTLGFAGLSPLTFTASIGMMCGGILPFIVQSTEWSRLRRQHRWLAAAGGGTMFFAALLLQ